MTKTVHGTYVFYSDGSIGVPFTQLAGGMVTIRSGGNARWRRGGMR